MNQDTAKMKQLMLDSLGDRWKLYKQKAAANDINFNADVEAIKDKAERSPAWD